MFEINLTNKFEKDVVKCSKRNLKLTLLYSVIELLGSTGTLPAKYKPHSLTGNWKGYKEAHIQTDWLIIWKQTSEKEITLFRTGTHSDLF